MGPIACTQDGSAPPLVVGDDPETWTPALWNDQNNALLEKGSFATSGLIFFYFKNTLGKTARLYVGAVGASGATSFQYALGRHVTSGGSNFEIVGALAEEKFLQPYVSGTGFTAASAPGGTASPMPLFSPLVLANGDLATGEVAVQNLSAATNFYVYGDDCSPQPCPGIQNIALDDTFRRGGVFGHAHFTIVHNWTVSISNSSGGIAYLDLGRSPTDACVPAIPGSDPLRSPSMRTLIGDFGVPIVIEGQPLGPFEQFWYLNPRGNVPYASALWVQNMTNPQNLHNVVAQAYYVPTTAPSAMPQPTVVPDTSHAITLGLDGAGDTRSLVYVPSGGDSWPVRFYYIVPAGLQHLSKVKQP